MNDDANGEPIEIAPAFRPVHSFFLVNNHDGSRFLQIFKRIDLRETVQVGGVIICEKEIAARAIGEKVCAIFDEELVTRGSGNG